MVRIIDASEMPPSIIMDYVEGINLEQAVTQDFFKNTKSIIDTIISIGNIVLSCHNHKSIILHRDLRPQNIMISGEYWDHIHSDQIRVLDFDLSWFEGASGHDYYMSPNMSLGYLAPEQINRGVNYSARNALVDVYGLAMLLFFMLTKQHPQVAASEKSNWMTRLDESVSAVYNKNWRILPIYLKNVMIDATSVFQDQRPKLSEFISSLENIRLMLGSEFVESKSIIMRELCIRAFDVTDISQKGSSLKTNTHAGVEIICTYVAQDDFFDFEINAVAADSADRQSMAKFLHSHLESAKQIAAAIGTVDSKRTSVGHSRNRLSFTVSAPRSCAAVDDLSKKLGRVSAAIKVN